jgi:preprotein translocase subunit SecG
MLSFLKDGQTIPAAAEAEQNGTEPSLTRQEDYLTVAGHGKKLKQSTILLIALFVIGGIGVFLMVKKATPSQANAAQAKDEQAEIESAIAQLNGMQSEMNSQMKSVTGRLNHLSEVGQIEVKDLKKNPFMREAASADLSADNPGQLQLLQAQAYKQAAGYTLWSITASPKGDCCMINDTLLYTGDKIESFTVTQIGKETVKIERDGVSIELKMN